MYFSSHQPLKKFGKKINNSKIIEFGLCHGIAKTNIPLPRQNFK